MLTRSLPSGVPEAVGFTGESPKSLVTSIRKHKGKSIWLMGGGEIARDFLKDHLAGELYLGIDPHVAWRRHPALSPRLPERKLRLLESKTYTKSLITLRYERSRVTPTQIKIKALATVAPVCLPTGYIAQLKSVRPLLRLLLSAS